MTSQPTTFLGKTPLATIAVAFASAQIGGLCWRVAAGGTHKRCVIPSGRQGG